MMPKAVHICHCITKAPRSRGGAVSAANMATKSVLVSVRLLLRFIFMTYEWWRIRARGRGRGRTSR